MRGQLLSAPAIVLALSAAACGPRVAYDALQEAECRRRAEAGELTAGDCPRPSYESYRRERERALDGE